MIKKWQLFFLTLSSFYLFSCENELDLSADYDETIVVYGLLDHTQDTQYVKINKTFLGSGNALDYAQVPDSFIYRDLNVTLTNTANNDIFILQPYNAPKEPGLFSHAENIVYITDEKLVGGNKYKLDVINNTTGEHANATTQIIDNIEIIEPSPNLPSVGFKTPNGFRPIRLRYRAKPNIYRYEVTMQFIFVEINKANTSIREVKRINYPLATKFLSEADNGEIIYLIDGESFYSKIPEVLSIDPTVDREIGGIQFITHAASEELQLYINANGPLDGISQVRPEYSNIENGYGLFASKIVDRSQVWPLGTESQTYLVSGDYTKNLGFKYP